MSNQIWKVAEAIGVEQARTLDEVLGLFDAEQPRRFIALFGNLEGASALLSELAGSRSLRTPSHRRLVGVVVDATELPLHIDAWQHLLLQVLGKLAESVNTPQNIVVGLRRQLEEMIQLERRRDEAASLAAAAFAHQFRSAFPGLLATTYSATNQIFVVGLDKLDRVDGVFAKELLESSQYFLSAPNCAVVLAADESRLLDNLRNAAPDGAQLMATWPTDRIAVPDRTTPSSGRAPLRPEPEAAPPPTSRRGRLRNDALTALPTDAARVLKEMLSPDQHAIEAACGEWQHTMAALHKRSEEGLQTKLTGPQIAKLVALKLLSPRLFEAARFDVLLLSRLERAARNGSADTSDEQQRIMALSSQLTGLFKSAPNFIGIEPRDIATALRLLSGGILTETTPQPTHTSQRTTPPNANTARRSTVRAAAQPYAASFGHSAPIAAFVAVNALVVLADRLTKQGSGAQAMLPNLSTSSLISNAAMLGMELTGLALALLILGFWGIARRSSLYHIAFGLITGALASNLYDHIVTGGVINFIPVAGIMINTGHLALLAGAALLVVSMFRPQPVVELAE
ncbi:MAG: P-loop NTPase fold protein [Chloroflexi bacterium]|nr:P-loop NTPase fold protein [Chloroflexota bacterium]